MSKKRNTAHSANLHVQNIKLYMHDSLYKHAHVALSLIEYVELGVYRFVEWHSPVPIGVHAV